VPEPATLILGGTAEARELARRLVEGRVAVTSSLAGRVATAFVAETPGVYRPTWSIEDVAANIDAIRDDTAPLVFPVVPDGHADHIRYSFGLAAHV